MPERNDPAPPPELPPPTPDPAPEPAPVRREPREYHNCDFCDCQLTRNGEVLRIGERAKKFQKFEAVIETLTSERDKLARELATVQSELAALKAAAKQPGGFFSR